MPGRRRPALGASGSGGSPTISFNGDNVVGGFGQAVLTAPKQLQSVTWQISGAVQYPQNPPLTNSKGDQPTALANPDQMAENGQSASLKFYWNLQTGSHTISASVVYANNGGTGTTNTVTVSVVAPRCQQLPGQLRGLYLGPDPSRERHGISTINSPTTCHGELAGHSHAQ